MMEWGVVAEKYPDWFFGRQGCAFAGGGGKRKGKRVQGERGSE